MTDFNSEGSTVHLNWIYLVFIGEISATFVERFCVPEYDSSAQTKFRVLESHVSFGSFTFEIFDLYIVELECIRMNRNNDPSRTITQ